MVKHTNDDISQTFFDFKSQAEYIFKLKLKYKIEFNNTTIKIMECVA